MTPQDAEDWARQFMFKPSGQEITLTQSELRDALVAYANLKLEQVAKVATHNGALTPSGIEAVIVKAKE